MENLSTNLEYKPILVSRRSEFTAWFLTACLILVVIFSEIPGLPKFGLYTLLAFIGLSALVMSIGNWVDRNTVLRIDEAGISYFNGAREVALGWDEIIKVEVIPTRFGDRILVSSEEAAFRYQSLGKVTMSDKVSGKVGFEEGEHILEMILTRSGLSGAERQQMDPGYYYSRD